MTEQVCEIKKVLMQHNSIYIDIDDELSLYKIHALICKHIVKEEPTNDIELFYFGWYYNNVEKNYILMKQYYLMAIENGYTNASCNLGHYYQHIEKDYDKMKQYYAIGIERKCTVVMHNLGHYYQYIEKDYDKMKHYFTMGIKHGNSDAIRDLLWYYEHEGKNDLSFVDFSDIPSFRPLSSKRLKVIKKVPKQFHSSFCKWNFEDDHELKMKQYILRKTGIYPCNYDPALLLHFMELMLLSEKPVALPKDIILTIAGYLFV